MPDDRDTPTAAPSTDGDNANPQTATAVQDPPAEEPAAEAKPEADEATAEAKVEVEEGGGAEEGGTEAVVEPEAPAKEATEVSADGEATEAAEASRRDPEPAPEVLESQIEADAASDEAASLDDAPAVAAPKAETEAKGDDDSDGPADKPSSADQSASKGDDDPSAATQAEKKPAAESPAKAGPAAESGDKAKAKAASDGGKADDKKAEIDDPALQALRKAKEEGTTVHGKVIGWNRGGFHVVIDEVTAFCPASEMELGRPRSPETYMDREMDFKVAKFQRRGRRVVLTRSDLLKSQRDEILAALKPGTVVKGTVTSLPDFGAFVDLGGVEGLVHVSEISRSRVKHPRDVLKAAQEVEVKVLSIEKGGDRISLSMKELEPDPWQGVAERYSRGAKFEGKVLRHADFGMFVELEPDVEGLVHVSQLPPGTDLKDESLQPGKPLEGWVREVDTKRGRISLSLREVPEDDPWKDVVTTLPEGEMVEGTVESIAPFGVFINLRPGLTGLLPNSQTGLPRGTNANRAFSPGSTVSVQILAVDPRRKRISLGREGSRVEATKADLQEFKQQQKKTEPSAPSAMEAAFAALGLSGGDDSES